MNVGVRRCLVFAIVLGVATVSLASALAAGVRLTGISVAPATAALSPGEILQFSALGLYSDGSTQDLTSSATWTTANTAIATISNAAGTKGRAQGTGQGTTTITAAYGAFLDSTALTVTAATLVSITVTPANPAIAVGTRQQFAASGFFSDWTTQNLTTQVTWASSNTAVATISNAAGTQGRATGVAAGTTTISATYGGIKGTTVLTVKNVTLVSIAVTPANAHVAIGAKLQMTATGTFTDNSKQNLTTQVTWASSKAAAASVSNAAGSQGVVTGVAIGSTTVTATRSGISGGTLVTVP